jgi:predicted DNA-binding antitoxin AbrB/MazE fold protein
MSEKQRFIVEAVYEDGVLRLLEPVNLPFGIKVRVVIEPVTGGEEEGKGVEETLKRLGLSLDEALDAIEAPEGLREAIEELVGHMASSIAKSVAGDERLKSLYEAVERLEPGKAAERIGPPPLDNDTWLLMLSDVLTVLEKAGLFQLTQPLRLAANNRLVNPYDLAHAALRGDKEFLEHEAERLRADPRLVYLAAAVLAEATRRGVERVLAGGGYEAAQSTPDAST